MKSSLPRRTLASLTFIAFLAAVYVVILLAGNKRHDGCDVANSVAVDTVSVQVTDSVGKSEIEGREKRKKKRRSDAGQKSAIGSQPDNPDVFDSPVPLIR